MSNIENKIFKAYIGFNTDYFKIGQLIKVSVRNYRGMFLEEVFGFIKYFDRDCITFVYTDNKGEEREKTIVPADLTQEEIKIKIEIIERNRRGILDE